jgi:hypothetical protein
MRFGAIAVAGLMVAAGAHAQQSGVKPGPTSHVLVAGGGCPGVLSARRHPNAEIWAVAREDKGKQDQSDAAHGMGVHVQFESTNAPLRTLELRVSYLPQRLRFMPVDPKFIPGDPKQDTRDSTKIFDLTGRNAMLIEGNLMVGPAATITRVHVVSATFADGNVWHAASEDECSVEPSKYMLVEAKR